MTLWMCVFDSYYDFESLLQSYVLSRILSTISETRFHASLSWASFVFQRLGVTFNSRSNMSPYQKVPKYENRIHRAKQEKRHAKDAG
jgi:hypothetical protein